MMAADVDDKKIAAIQFGLDLPFWKEFMLPEIQERARSLAETLMLERSDQDDIKRGWFQALRWVISLPAQTIESYRTMEDKQEQDARLADLDEHRAKYGFRSPYPGTPPPGETTGEAEG